MTSEPATSVLNRRLARLGDLRLDHKNWANPRSFTGLTEDDLDELAGNIKVKGIEVSPHVVQVKSINGTTIDLVTDGQRRVLAALRVFDKDTEIEVVDMEPEPVELTPQKAAEILERVLNIGANRADLSSYEYCEAAAKLRDGGLKLSQIARSIHKSETWVSKMLSARDEAKPALMLAWKKGEVTDEQFKDLAKVRGDKTQSDAVKLVTTTREGGDKAEARIKAKELAEAQKQKTEKREEKREAKVTNGANGHSRTAAPVVKGPQADLFDKNEPARVEVIKAPPRATLEELVRMGEKKPPTHEYVKGIMAGVKYSLGFTSPDKFLRPWVVYLARFEGRAVADVRKERAAAKKQKPARAAKKARKPAKRAKSAKKSRR